MAQLLTIAIRLHILSVIEHPGQTWCGEILMGGYFWRSEFDMPETTIDKVQIAANT